MQITKLSSKGQVIIPKAIRNAYHLEIGQELEVEIIPQGILLRAKKTLPTTTTLCVNIPETLSYDLIREQFRS